MHFRILKHNEKYFVDQVIVRKISKNGSFFMVKMKGK